MQNTSFSPIIAGTMLWGQWGVNMDTAQMAEMINHCFETGMTSFDHADIYGGYTTESAFGKALAHSGLKREDIQLISKCGIKMVAPGKTYRLGHYDYATSYIVQCCEQSLKNLGTDYLDLFLMHRPSPLMRGEDIAEAALTLNAQGKIRSFGLSNFTPSQTEMVRQYVPVAYNQIEFSLTHHTPLTDGSLEYMQVHHITPMAWAPMGSVFKEDNPQTQRIKNILNTLSLKYNKTEDILVLNWILKHPSKIIPVIGTTKKERVSASMVASQFVMEQEDWFELWVASMGHPVP